MPVKHALLALLLDEPRSASQLQHRFAATTFGVWPLNIGQVTQTLARLVRDDLVTSAGTTIGVKGHTSEVYTLTDAGKQAVTDWFGAAVLRPPNERDELVTKVALAATRDDIDLQALLDKQRRAALVRLRELTKQARDLDHTRRADRLLVERHIYDLEAEARWLDRVEALSTVTLPDATTSEGDQTHG